MSSRTIPFPQRPTLLHKDEPAPLSAATITSPRRTRGLYNGLFLVTPETQARDAADIFVGDNFIPTEPAMSETMLQAFAIVEQVEREMAARHASPARLAYRAPQSLKLVPQRVTGARIVDRLHAQLDSFLSVFEAPRIVEMPQIVRPSASR